MKHPPCLEVFMSLRPIRALLLVAGGLLAVPGPTFGYAVALHDRLADVLAADPALGVAERATLPDEAGLAQFRERVYAAFAATGDARLRERFLRRYPTAASFSAAAFKEFLGSAAVMPVLGFDSYAAVAASVAQSTELPPHYGEIGPETPRPLLEWVRIGSAYPDLDRRNQSRWWVIHGEFPLTRDGERIPFDPAILNMGHVDGLSGQAHAHYGLNDRPKSDAPAVLKSTPADFAVAAGFDGPVLTFAPERAQAYADLAVLARHWDEPALAALLAGNAFHYLADVANQIHTIQVGIYRFFVDATFQVWTMKLRCLWGLLCEPPGLKAIGIDIIGNHHTWLEEYFRIAVEVALAGAPLHPALTDAVELFSADDRLRRQWSELRADGPLMRALCRRLIAYGNEEGPVLYALAREVTRSGLRRAGVRVEFGREPDSVVLAYLKPDADQARLGELLRLQKLGLIRAATAMDLWWRATLAPGTGPDWRIAAERLLRQQLDELEAADVRRARWIEQRGGLMSVAPSR